MSNFSKEDNLECEYYCLTKWGCMYSVLNDYNIDTSEITRVIGSHMIDDLLALLEKLKYIKIME